MALSDRENEFNEIINRMEDSEKKGLYSQILALCDELSANFQDLLDMNKVLFLKGIRGRALTKTGKFEEAKRFIGELLEYNINHRLPVASSPNMYIWLCAYYNGDEKMALDEQIKLTDDEKAINLIRQPHIHVQELPPSEGQENIPDNEVSEKLLNAAKEGNYDEMKKLVEQGAYINAVDEKKNTALYFAAAAGNFDAVKYLVEKGAKLNIRHSSGQLALDRAAQEGYIDVVKYLADHGSLILVEPVSPLWLAAQKGHLSVVKYLVDEKKLDMNQSPAGLGTALHFAAGGGFLDVVRFLVEKGADTSARTKFGHETPVEMARSCLKLIDESKNSTAAEKAADKKRIESVIKLLSGEGDVKDKEVQQCDISKQNHYDKDKKPMKPKQWWKFWE